ncbi:hypothetical protein lerEdw1_001427 [Lerista edwardsae]|nr:hypothetical protein lerEdw1_001427 [Lerista edwardsae]
MKTDLHRTLEAGQRKRLGTSCRNATLCVHHCAPSINCSDVYSVTVCQWIVSPSISSMILKPMVFCFVFAFSKSSRRFSSSFCPPP